MSPLVVGVVLLLLVKDISGTSFSSLSTQQGGYQNVLLVIGDDVPNTDCASVLENVKVTQQIENLGGQFTHFHYVAVDDSGCLTGSS